MVKDWLSKPFPYIESFRNQLLVSTGAGGMVALFLLVFQPFGIDMVAANIFWPISVFGLISMSAISLNLIFLPLVFPRWVNIESWTIGKNLLFIFWILLLISLLNYGYGQYLAGSPYTKILEQNDRMGVLSWMLMTISVGIFPVFLIVYFAERQLLNQNQRLAKEVTKGISHTLVRDNDEIITLEAGKSSSIEVNSAEILCVKAEGGNYLTVYWRNELGCHNELVRMTLLNFLEKVENIESFIRCHKSYIVNLDKIESVNGNARSLVLILDGLEFQVPVSRSFPREKLVKIKN
jgi:LytTr DNA-binding domain